jgi:YVTN family beta-propeller protein
MNRATLPAAGLSLLALALAAPPAAAEPLSGLADPGHYVFVPSRASAEVAVIDIRLDRVVARVPVGRVPHQVVVADTLGRLATTNTADDTLSIVDLADLSTLATLALDLEPEHMELGPDGDLLAVGNIAAGTVSLVSLGEAREVARIAGLHQPHNMTFSPDGRQLYVGNLGAGFVSVIDVEQGAVVAEIPVGEPQLAATGAAAGEGDFQGIINVTRTPDGRLGFAAYGEGDRMAVIDLRTGATLATLQLGSQPWRAYSTADGRHMIVPNNGEATVSVISTASLEEVARLPGAADMIGVNTGWFETVAFVLSRSEEKAVILDLERMEPAGELALPGTPETGVVTPDGTRLYVALSSTDRVAVIDVRERRLVKVIEDVGEEPWGAHMVGALNYCH